ncbi:MAG: hypothetical protein IT207_04955 [Fimbriimonadaceae bacterium]|nr:hypothetical protein [Fimbriimonadaceae bacterium]
MRRLLALLPIVLFVVGCPAPSPEDDDHRSQDGSTTFSWLTDAENQKFQEVNIGHGQSIRLLGRGDIADLTKLIEARLKQRRVNARVRYVSSGTAGEFRWYEVQGTDTLIIEYTPSPRPSSTFNVEPVERVVAHRDLRTNVYHKQLSGKQNASRLAAIFVKAIENPEGLLSTHATAMNAEFDDLGTTKNVRGLTAKPLPSSTLTLTGGPCPASGCVVCVVSLGAAKVTPVPNSNDVNVDFTADEIILKMY